MALVAVLSLALQACSLTPYTHGSLDDNPVLRRAVEQQQNDFVVRASVPSENEAKQLFGIPIYQRGIQPVWLEITNNSDSGARLILSSIDQNYFAPLEVAYMHKKYFSKQGWMDMEKFLYENAMPRMIPAGATESGFVFTHASRGTKSFNVDIFTAGQTDKFEDFTFFIEVPGFVPDHKVVDFAALYTTGDLVETDLNGLEDVLADLPCCTTNRQGEGQGQPVNVALVGTGRSILRALLRAGWTENAYDMSDNYLNNSDYLYERPPDATFRISRGKTTERNELSLWLTPIRVDGDPVWLGQVKHAIGRRYEISEVFFGTSMDPDVDDGRNYLLQNLWYSQSLLAFAVTKTGLEVPVEDPLLGFRGTPFFTDGGRIVMWISGDPVALDDVRNLLWNVKSDSHGGVSR
ncbi:LssY C-terminal domain-containing protein [Pseudomonadota bacterium]